MVKVKYNKKSDERKKLAKSLGEATLQDVTYLGPPTYAYKVGPCSVDKDGTVVLPDNFSDGYVEQIIAKISDLGFTPITVESEDSLLAEGSDVVCEAEDPETSSETDLVQPIGESVGPEEPNEINEPEVTEEAGSEDTTENAVEAEEQPETDEQTSQEKETEPEAENVKEPTPEEALVQTDLSRFSLGDTLYYSFPENTLSTVGWGRLNCLISSKETLLKKALKLDELNIIKEKGRRIFPWCKYDGNPNRVRANMQLLEAMLNMARDAKYIHREEKPIDNEKFAMRIFMVRLNMKGEQYKIARKVLMENLSGNSAWRTGKAPEKNKEAYKPDSGFSLPTNCQIVANMPVADASDQPEEAEAQNNTENEGEADVQEC